MTDDGELRGLLVAYVDGELDDARIQAVEDELARNPAARELVAVYQNTASLLKAAFPESRYAEGGLPLPARPATRSTGRTARRGWAIAASLLLGLVGYGAGVLWPVPLASEAAMLRADIAGYHEVYARETVHLVEVDASQASHIKAWLGARVHRQIVIPDLAAAGLTFAGARMVALDGRPVAALMYTREHAPPIAFCIANIKADRGKVVEQHGGISVATWGDGSHLFVVVGEGPKQLIEGLATQVQQQI